jgi:hypothetical protein
VADRLPHKQQYSLGYTASIFNTQRQEEPLYRFWNIIEYWSPNLTIIGDDWGEVLRHFLPQVVLARDRDEYQREVMALNGMPWEWIQVSPAAR